MPCRARDARGPSRLYVAPVAPHLRAMPPIHQLSRIALILAAVFALVQILVLVLR